MGQKLASQNTRFPVWIVLLDHRSAPWLRWTATARAQHPSTVRPIRWLDSSAPGFRPQAYGFAPKTLEHTLFVRSAAGYWHSGFDALLQLERLLNLPSALPRQWYQRARLSTREPEPDELTAQVN